VLAPSGEGERYLFYRGVAHLDALVQTRVTASEIELRSPQRLLWMTTPSMTIPALWLVDVKSDGSVAYRQQGEIRINKDRPSQDLGRIPLFADADYQTRNLATLRASMKQSLIDAGLFNDEAEAMLETWRESYFGNPGLRIFYMVPREWINYFLPLSISVPHDLTRVLVGRIDLERP
jgi:hypothetical protein